MGKRYRNLISMVTCPENIRDAYRKASKGRRSSSGYLNFKEYEAFNLAKIRKEITDGSYRPGRHRRFYVYEPKQRLISALPFYDRVVQHALIAVIGPIFTRTMLHQSWACIKGRGMHDGAKAAQAMIRKKHKRGDVYVLKTDYSKFFPSIRLDVLWERIEAKISCRATLRLIEKFTPRAGRGLPIGNLTSQLWANVAGTMIDRYLANDLRIGSFARYMDDIVVIHNSRAVLEGVRDFLDWYGNHSMDLFFSKESIRPASLGVNFLGFRIFKDYKLLRRDSVTRAKRKIRKYISNGEHDKLRLFAASWYGHAAWADSKNLLKYMNDYARCQYVCVKK
ncbi:MAG: Retron-type reverse transcriptase [Marinospirillum sp.]|uniref:reverse transcriptase domain-containing protein n=1 Tax=Marinospirillum sp. TaxID=2183934 RepID=UPI0019F318B3|nr:reverse transcriptase domain-containing protein [Marinospirillum sp.]MBE0505902.1 Retron-type reverse transcriptase [Marinospirillum sp.]